MTKTTPSFVGQGSCATKLSATSATSSATKTTPARLPCAFARRPRGESRTAHATGSLRAVTIPGRERSRFRAWPRGEDERLGQDGMSGSRLAALARRRRGAPDRGERPAVGPRPSAQLRRGRTGTADDPVCRRRRDRREPAAAQSDRLDLARRSRLRRPAARTAASTPSAPTTSTTTASRSRGSPSSSPRVGHRCSCFCLCRSSSSPTARSRGRGAGRSASTPRSWPCSSFSS